MKKFILLIVTLMLVITNFCSCDIEVSKWTVTHICGSYAVPGMFDPDAKSSGAKILEQDEYGRILFAYTRLSVITEQIESVAVVCQKYDRSFVYYYEDVCYTPYNYDEADIEIIKRDNDWNQPLNEERMSRRSIKTTLDGVTITEDFLSYRTVKSTCTEALNIDTERLEECCIVDVNAESYQVMYFVKMTNENFEIEKYLAILDEEYKVDFLLIENDYISNSAVAEFKAQCGWKYGY